MYEAYPTPAVLVDLDTVERNIKRFAEKNARCGIAHRPHIKAHKSIFLAKKQLELGCRGITCAKLSEALVMAQGGIDDILVAFPIIGADKLDLLNQLLQFAKVTTIVNSAAGAHGLSGLGEQRGSPVPVLIEIDGGIQRGGLPPMQPALEFAQKIASLPGIAIQGLLYYGGTIYGCRTDAEIIECVKKGRAEVLGTADLLRRHGFQMDYLSVGSSYSARFPEYLEGMTEVRAGNYIFGDNSQLCSGLIREEDCALRVISTVVSRPDQNSAIIDAGSKALTSDQGAFTKGFGYIAEAPEAELYKLNEEHGFVRSQAPLNWEIGQKIAIIPNHACVICNLNDEVYGVRGGKLERMIRIDARGKSV